MKAEEMVNVLNRRLKNGSKPKAMRLDDDGFALCAGQLWEPAVDVGEAPSWLFLVLELLDDGLFNGVPVFRWSELAGPDDVYVPASLAGSTLIASLELESTLKRDALKRCFGRLSDEVVDYVADALCVVDDETAKRQYSWGSDYFDVPGTRLDFHKTVNEQLETMQQSVLNLVYGNAEKAAINDVINADFGSEENDSRIIDLLLNVGQSELGIIEGELALAAHDGEPMSTCEIRPYPAEGGRVRDGGGLIQTHALCEQFDTLVPGSDEEICCEWFVEYDSEYAAIKGAVLYADGIEQPIGMARVYREEGKLHLVLTRHDLPANAQPVTDPAKIRIVIYVEGV